MATDASAAGQVIVGDFTVNHMGFGAMRVTGKGIWGEPEDHDNAITVLKRAVELGVNFIDTADAYGPNVSENLLREALYPYKGLVIATKGGLLRGGPDDWHPDGRPEHLREAIEGSLERLDVNQIQVYQMHHPDPKVPYQDSIKALVDLKNEGKIKYIGVSNVSLEQLKLAESLTPIVSVQNHYNFETRAESEAILEYCEHGGIAFIPYFPLGGSRTELSTDVMRAVAAKYDATCHQIALAWLLARSPVMLPIPGTSSIDHLEENVAAARIHLDPEDMAAIDSLSD